MDDDERRQTYQRLMDRLGAISVLYGNTAGPLVRRYDVICLLADELLAERRKIAQTDAKLSAPLYTEGDNHGDNADTP